MINNEKKLIRTRLVTFPGLRLSQPLSWKHPQKAAFSLYSALSNSVNSLPPTWIVSEYLEQTALFQQY